jgi:hypothetical protein
MEVLFMDLAASIELFSITACLDFFGLYFLNFLYTFIDIFFYNITSFFDLSFHDFFFGSLYDTFSLDNDSFLLFDF